MRSNPYGARNEAREELARERQAAGLVAERLPGVSSIIVKMNYKRQKPSAIIITLNYYPGSAAFFRTGCLGEGCGDGWLDLTRVIHRMVRDREKTANGEISCGNTDPAIPHADVDYHVSITYV